MIEKLEWFLVELAWELLDHAAQILTALDTRPGWFVMGGIFVLLIELLGAFSERWAAHILMYAGG